MYNGLILKIERIQNESKRTINKEMKELDKTIPRMLANWEDLKQERKQSKGH